MSVPKHIPHPADDPNRRTKRYLHREVVHFRKPYEFQATTVDIGAGGVGVEVPLPLATGVAVVVEIFEGHAIAQGTVRWGRPHESGYRVGIQFIDEDWSIIARVHALKAKAG